VGECKGRKKKGGNVTEKKEKERIKKIKHAQKSKT
jgi:hypothetical protein